MLSWANWWSRNTRRTSKLKWREHFICIELYMKGLSIDNEVMTKVTFNVWCLESLLEACLEECGPVSIHVYLQDIKIMIKNKWYEVDQDKVQQFDSSSSTHKATWCTKWDQVTSWYGKQMKNALYELTHLEDVKIIVIYLKWIAQGKGLNLICFSILPAS
jgi:hypothetical protein